MGPRTPDFEEAFARATRSAPREWRCRAAPRRCTSPIWPPASGPGDEVIVPSYTIVATAAAVLYCGRHAGVRGHRRRSSEPLDRPRRTSSGCITTAPEGGRASCTSRGYAAAADRLAELCASAGSGADRGRRPLAAGDARGPQPRHLGPGGGVQLLLQQGPVRRRGRAAVPPTTTRSPRSRARAARTR